MKNGFSEVEHLFQNKSESRIWSCLIDSSSIFTVRQLLFEEPADDRFRYAYQQE